MNNISNPFRRLREQGYSIMEAHRLSKKTYGKPKPKSRKEKLLARKQELENNIYCWGRQGHDMSYPARELRQIITELEDEH